MTPTSLKASSSSGADAVGTSVLLLLPPATAATNKAKGFERLQLRSIVKDPDPVGSETFSRKKSYRIRPAPDPNNLSKTAMTISQQKNTASI
jgi:hypothetical protein